MTTTPYNQIVTNDHDTTGWLTTTGPMTTSHVPIEVSFRKQNFLTSSSLDTKILDLSLSIILYPTNRSPVGSSIQFLFTNLFDKLFVFPTSNFNPTRQIQPTSSRPNSKSIPLTTNCKPMSDPLTD